MKKLVSILLISFVALSSALLAADTILEFFRTSTSGNSVNLEWKSLNEQNINRYEVERKSSSQSFRWLHTEKSNGNLSSYKYTDNEAFLKEKSSNSTLSKNVYTYRIKIVYNDGSSTYSAESTVTQKLSGIERTWGMIKEMFR